MNINFRHEINGEKLVTAIAQDYETNEMNMFLRKESDLYVAK